MTNNVLTETERYQLEKEIRSDPVKWAFWKLKDQNGNPWKARWYQRNIIEDILHGDKRIASRMGRRVGKCLPGWTKIFDPESGRLITIKELYETKEATVATMNKNYKLSSTDTSQVWDNGVKEVYKAKLKTGRVIEATGNHPLYRVDGWTEIDDLKPGDKVATPRELNFFGNEYIKEEKVKLLAYMLSESGRSSHDLKFVSTSEEVLSDFKKSISYFGDIGIRENKDSKIEEYFIDNDLNVRQFIKENNLFQVKDEDREIPDIVYQMPKEKIALFLSRLYAIHGWGTVTYGPKKHLEIGYSTSSESVARGVQHLLLRFGIQSYLRERIVRGKGVVSKRYYLGIFGKRYVTTFSNEIDIFSKETDVAEVIRLANTMKEKDDHIPKEIMKEVEELRIANGIRPKEMLHPNASMHARYKREYGPQRKTLNYWSDVLGSKRLKDLSESDLYWDQIESIESIGQHQTYDLTIPETKNFVANDIIVHNTEVMVVFALWYAFHNKNARLLFATPYENQVRLIFMRLNELINDCSELEISLKRRTSNPFIIEFNNGSAIMGFTVGATKGQAGASVRGQRADFIFIDEIDYINREGIDATTSIALENPKEIGIWISSTPTGKRDFFYNACTNPRTGYKSYHFPSMVNPNFDEKMEGELRATMTEQAYIHEVLAEFGEETVGVFNKEAIDRATTQYVYSYFELNAYQREEFKKKGFNLKDIVYFPTYSKSNPAPPAYRVVGIDWDKYGEATQIIVTEFDELLKKFRVAHRYEIPKGDFTFDNAVQKAIEVNEIWNPKFIYVDGGSGEYQIETLRLYGKDNPETGLDKKVKRIQFSQNVEIRDPVTKEVVQKQAKGFMVDQTSILLERDQIAMSPFDDIIWTQMQNYQVVRRSASGDPIFTSEDDHALDALMLTILGFTLEFPDITNIIFKMNPATKAFSVKSNEVERIREKMFSNESDVYGQKKKRKIEIQSSARHTNNNVLGYKKKRSRGGFGRSSRSNLGGSFSRTRI